MSMKEKLKNMNRKKVTLEKYIYIYIYHLMSRPFFSVMFSCPVHGETFIFLINALVYLI